MESKKNTAAAKAAPVCADCGCESPEETWVESYATPVPGRTGKYTFARREIPVCIECARERAIQVCEKHLG
jgi:hypothetical protein